MAIIKDLYFNKIDRPLNPAVSAEDFSEKTIETEIDEYVFTDEIINGLYNVLSAIWMQNVSHNGIWINGFFGSGKSHFLKYLGYCINPSTRENALGRLLEAVEERDPLTVSDSKSNVTIDDMKQLAAWVKKATIDIVLFNIGTVHDTNSEQQEVFTQVFWNQFNRFRGYNSFNLALAQHLEKVLDKNGKFEEFKSRLKEQGFDWDEQASMLATVCLDMILDLAKELLPIITIDSLRKAIMDDKENVSPEAFCSELKEFVDKKEDKNYRLLFLVDEVSQFIGTRQGLLLQLQEVVTGLHKYCNDKVWVACTAQQDLSQLMSNMQIVSTSEDYGKIMGRFEVRVSLKGTQTEYITQKRLLAKNIEGENLLHSIYADKKLAIEDQFALPASFHSFKDEETFVNYYPFVPYQFKLIKMVLDSFGKLRYIDAQSRGNERSIIKITHSTAIKTMDEPVGQFVSFDKFYNAMFEGSLMASGQRAINNAKDMIQEYDDVKFAEKVVNILFMICNLSDPDKLLFPATEEHIVTLLMEDVDTNKAELINRVERTLAFLDQKHIIRTEKFTDGRADIYCFQSEDEIDAAREIESMNVDQATMANYFCEIFRKHFRCSTTSNREIYCSRSFNIGWSIYGRTFYSNNADIVVEFTLGKAKGDNTLFGSNEPYKLTFNVEAELNKDKLLVNDFFWYCQVQKFVAESNRVEVSTSRGKTIKAFSERALDVYNNHIVPKMNAILNRCDIISGNSLIAVDGEGMARYKRALEIHFGNVYSYAKLVMGAEVPTTLEVLRNKIQRKIEANEYGAINPLTEAEQQIVNHISNQIGTVYVSEVIHFFASRPYGWSDFATAYFLNELRRRQRYAFKYGNDANIDNRIIAQNLIKEQNKFTVVVATSISQELINSFIEAWKYALNIAQAPTSYESNELFRMCKQTLGNEKHVSIQSIMKHYQERRKEIGAYPFAVVLDDALDLLEKWNAERDPKKFFELVIADKEKAQKVFDKCKALKSFMDDYLEGYKDMRNFAEANRDNFNFVLLPDKVNALLDILTDEWPVPNMRTYSALVRDIKRALENVKKGKREEIKAAYLCVFEELRAIATENKVEYQIDEASVIHSMTMSDNLYILDKNLDVTDYRARQVEDIMKRRPVVVGTSATGTSVSGVHEPVPRRTRMVTLKTGSTSPLNTEADVDAYLAKLKQQLMTVVNSRQENDDIMVK